MLIGPEMYRPWLRAVAWTLGTVLPIVLISLVAVYAVIQDNIWVTCFRPLGITLTVAAYLFSAVTALCALLDRRRE